MDPGLNLREIDDVVRTRLIAIVFKPESFGAEADLPSVTGGPKSSDRLSDGQVLALGSWRQRKAATATASVNGSRPWARRQAPTYRRAVVPACVGERPVVRLRV